MWMVKYYMSIELDCLCFGLIRISGTKTQGCFRSEKLSKPDNSVKKMFWKVPWYWLRGAEFTVREIRKFLQINFLMLNIWCISAELHSKGRIETPLNISLDFGLVALGNKP